MAVALSPTYQSKLLTDPRYMSAVQGLQNGTSMAPVKGGWAEGVARALSAGLYSSAMKDIENDFAQKDKNNNETIQQAFDNGQALPAETKQYKDGTSIDWQARPADFNRTIQALSQNPETADLATQMLSIQAKAQIDNQMKANEPLTPFQRLQLQTENQVDAYGNIVPKYSLDRAGGLPPVGGAAAALSAPIQNPTTAAPNVQQMPVGTIQPPPMRGTPDSTPTTPAAALLAPPSGVSPPPILQKGGTVKLPRTGLPRVDIEIMAQEAKANADLQKAQAETNQNAISGAQGYLQKVGVMQSMLKQKGADSLVGPVQGSWVGKTADSFLLPENEKERERLAAQIAGMELDVAKMQLKGQGSVTENERAIARAKLNSLTDVDASSSLQKLDDLTNEAVDMLRRSGYTEDQIAQTLKQYGVSASAAVDAQKPAHVVSQPSNLQNTPQVPAIGAIMDGHRFKGGDPSKPESWEAVR